MKINMIFNLEDEMDKVAYEDARLGSVYRQWTEEFADYLRKRLKYEELSEKEFETIEAIKEEFYKIRAEVMD